MTMAYFQGRLLLDSGRVIVNMLWVVSLDRESIMSTEAHILSKRPCQLVKSGLPWTQVGKPC